MNIEAEYQIRYPKLKVIGQKIEEFLKDILRNTPRIDAITVRAKSQERFIEKANRLDKEGNQRYQYPLHDIQDQIGARIVVFYKSDVAIVDKLITDELRMIEDRMRVSPYPEHFGYEAKHCVCLIPPDMRRNNDCPIDFFELQISTLFQHAWAEANHDLGYKPGSAMDFDTQRKIAWAAAQAWGADNVFDELWRLRNN
jgi:ppGpp synthetase/RelA/SpoT-type nucleotidyltranferase